MNVLIQKMAGSGVKVVGRSASFGADGFCIFGWVDRMETAGLVVLWVGLGKKTS